MQEGVEDYLIKDQINSSLLERSIRYAIGRSMARRDLEAAYEKMEQKVIERTAALADANAELEKSSEKMKRFAYSVSHDLKNPAVSIYGLTRRLFNDYAYKLDEKGQQYCEHILHAAEQISALVEHINLYIATKELPFASEDIRLGDVCEGIREEFSPQLELRKIQWMEPTGNPVIRAHRLSIIRAIRNLVDNALKYGGEGLSRISIHYMEKPEHHIISVNDDGDGLSEEDPAKIFGLFFREKRPGKETPNGTGLGLSIVKEIAERHQGEVWAESGRPKGVTIFMSILKRLHPNVA
jgi:signal transduction histidine kinase